MAGGDTLVPKSSPRPTIAELRAQLFALPVPPPPTKTRTYSIDTALGRIMRLRGLSITQVAKLGGPSARQISDHLCQVRALTPDNRIALAHLLGVDIRLL